MNSSHCIYCYRITRNNTRCLHFMSYSFRLAAINILQTPSITQDSTHGGLCYTSSVALDERIHQGGSSKLSIAPQAEALPHAGAMSPLPRLSNEIRTRDQAAPSVTVWATGWSPWCESSSLGFFSKELHHRGPNQLNGRSEPGSTGDFCDVHGAESKSGEETVSLAAQRTISNTLHPQQKQTHNNYKHTNKNKSIIKLVKVR